MHNNLNLFFGSDQFIFLDRKQLAVDKKLRLLHLVKL
jgi:hypothetical protein